MTVITRTITPADVPAVWRLMREFAEREGLSQYFALTEETLRQFCFGTPARLEIVVAVVDGEIAGYASFLTQLSPWGGREYLYLDDLYLAGTRRGAGIGSRLMEHVAAIAAERDLEVRWHVETNNPRAQKFYASLGAELRSRFMAYWSRQTIRSRTSYGREAR